MKTNLTLETKAYLYRETDDGEDERVVDVRVDYDYLLPVGKTLDSPGSIADIEINKIELTEPVVVWGERHEHWDAILDQYLDLAMLTDALWDEVNRILEVIRYGY